MTKISTWLVSSCGVEADKANLIETQIIDKFWITSVESLQEMLDVMPEILDALKLPEPTTRLLRLKVGSFNCKRLETLTTREVQLVLSGIFPDGEYADMFITKKINGFVLSTVSSAEKLIQWGMPDEDHAQLLWQKLAHWKMYGVPLEYLETKLGEKRDREPSPVRGSSSSTIVLTEENTTEADVEQTSTTAIGLLQPIQELQDAEELAISSPVAKKARKSVNRELAALRCDNAAAQQRARLMGLRGSRATAPSSASRGRHGSSRELSSLLADNANPRFNTETSSTSTRVLSSPAAPRTTSASNSTQSLPDLARSENDGSSASRKTKAPPAATISRTRSEPALATTASKPVVVSKAAASPRVREEKKDPLVAMLDSTSNATKIRALREYSRQAVKEPAKIKGMCNSGALSRMLKFVSQAATVDEEVVWWCMVVLNNAIAIGPFFYTKYLVDHGIIATAAALCGSLSAKLRLQALWILGNLGVSDGEKGFKSVVASHAIVTDIVKSFWSIGRMTDNAPESPLLRYATTMKQLTSDCTPALSPLLVAIAPILREIISQPACVATFVSAVDATCNLIATNEGTIVASLLQSKIVQALVGRLDDAKVKIVQCALRGLSALADGSNSDQILELAPALPRLESLVRSASGFESKPRTSQAALQFLFHICQGGSRCVALVVNSAPTMFPSLLTIVRRALEQSKGQQVTCGAPKPDDQARFAALALVSATVNARTRELEYLTGLGLYPQAFAVLSFFDGDDEVVQVAVKAIHRILFKYEAIHALQTQSEGKFGFRTEMAWENVRGLAGRHLEVNCRERYSEQELTNSEEALKLWNTAVGLELAQE